MLSFWWASDSRRPTQKANQIAFLSLPVDNMQLWSKMFEFRSWAVIVLKSCSGRSSLSFHLRVSLMATWRNSDRRAHNSSLTVERNKWTFYLIIDTSNSEDNKIISISNRRLQLMQLTVFTVTTWLIYTINYACYISKLQLQFTDKRILTASFGLRKDLQHCELRATCIV